MDIDSDPLTPILDIDASFIPGVDDGTHEPYELMNEPGPSIESSFQEHDSENYRQSSEVYESDYNSSTNSNDSAEHDLKDTEDDDTETNSDNDPEYEAECNTVVEDINKCFAALNIPAIETIKGTDFSQKYQEASGALWQKLNEASKRKPKLTDCADCKDILEGAKSVYKESSIEKKYLILTSLPKSMNAYQISKHLGCSRRLVTKALEMRKNHGPYSAPVRNKPNKRKITENVAKLVANFYKDKDNARALPSKRDTIRIRDPETKVWSRVGKYRLLLTLPELYTEFKNAHPNIEISFSSFVLLRPKECVPVGKNMFQNTCTCIIHENFDLMLCALGENVSLDLVLGLGPCDMHEEKCMMGLCENCPKDFDSRLFGGIADLEQITYYQWNKAGTEIFETTENVKDFKNTFLKKLPELLQHHFIMKKQNLFVKTWSATRRLHPNEAIIEADFAQNYSFIFQDAIQSAHWSHKQATVHPFHVRYTCPITNAEKTLDYIIISDDLKHNTVAFYSFQECMLRNLTTDLPHIKHIRYVTDGSAAQYKNYKNLINMLFHQKDFGLTATLEFQATSHGKGDCDRLSAVVKSTVRRDSLRKIKGTAQITTALEMYQHLIYKPVQYENRKYLYVPAEKVRENYLQKLKKRFQCGSTIPGTQSFHSFKPVGDSQFEARKYTLQETCHVFSFNDLETHDVKENDHLLVSFNGSLEIGVVTAQDFSEIIVEFFKKTVTKASIRLTWPQHRARHSITPSDILCKLSQPVSTTKSKRLYSLHPDDEAKVVAMHKK